MKKNKLTLIVAVLLLATMLLASCNPGGKDGSDTPPLLNKVENNHSEAIGAWAEYLSYIAPESTPNYTSTKLLSKLKEAAAIYDEIFVVEEKKENFKTVTPTPAEASESTESQGGAENTEPPKPVEVLVSTTYTEKWYNKNTGALIKTFTTVVAEKTLVEGVLKYDETINPTDIVAYSINYDDNGLIRVETTTLALVEQEEGAEPLDAKAVDSYEENKSISYYFADGTLFLEKLEDTLVRRSAENTSAINADRYLLDSEELGKTFLMEDGALIKEFEYKMEYNIPVYDEDSTSINGQGYAYFEKNGNKYVIKENAPVYMPMGDLYLYLVQGMSISVTDKNDKALANYEASCYGISGYAVLSNGNIYVCEFELLNRDAAEYDILSGEDKLNVNHKLISIADGSVTNLNISFKTSKLFNNTTKEIKSFLNYATLGVEEDMEHTLLDNSKVKEGYILAEIQKYEAGNLDAATTWVILDESFNIVKELPTIIADQFTYPSFMSADVMVVSARTVGNKVLYYGANVKTGEITLLPDLDELQEVEVLKNGYFWNNKVYDLEWNELHDFNISTTSTSSHNVYSNFQVINGALYYQVHSSSVQNPTKWTVHKLTISFSQHNEMEWEYDPETGHETYVDIVVTEYNHNVAMLTDSGYLYNGNMLVKVSGEFKKYYNINNDVLFEELTAVEYIKSDKLNSNVKYDVKKTVSRIEETENGYLVCMKLAYKENDPSTKPEDSGLPETFTEYEYYIIK